MFSVSQQAFEVLILSPWDLLNEKSIGSQPDRVTVTAPSINRKRYCNCQHPTPNIKQ